MNPSAYTHFEHKMRTKVIELSETMAKMADEGACENVLDEMYKAVQACENALTHIQAAKVFQADLNEQAKARARKERMAEIEAARAARNTKLGRGPGRG
jgi:mannose/cellobiose epimerase-like protein (N-acyl-D-glucosamine 2-epimerase family)